jgi:hypothetical protein
MAHQREILEAIPQVAGAQPKVRPSLRFAFQISLGIHALMILMLFRMYSEYISQPIEPVQIIARASAPRETATPSFVAVPLVDEMLMNETEQDEPDDPVAVVEPLPQQATSFAAAPQLPFHQSVSVARRMTAPAALPPTKVELPTLAVTPIADARETVMAPPTTNPLARTETPHDIPIRVASRPVYGPRPQRPLGLAAMAEALGQEKQLRPASAFAHRHAGIRMPPENRTAIDRGLEFLARVQLDDGRWQFRNLRRTVDPNAERPSPRADAAATGLALLAFLGAGHDHVDGRYRRVVADGLDYLIRSQQADGEFFPLDGRPTSELTQFYSHGIAALALCEAYGMTGDEELRGPAQKSLDFLAGAHHTEPGGWRFLPGIDADAAAIGWQLATLRSGQLAGLTVDPQTMSTIRAFLARTRADDSRQSTPVASAVGMAVELHLGDAPTADRFRPVADELLAHLPEVSDAPDDSLTFAADSSQRNTYYWYYGSEAMYQLGGDDWNAWSQQLYPPLLKSQTQDGPLAGSWSPAQLAAGGPATSGGRLYLTAMNLLSLEIQNRNVPTAMSVAVPPQSATSPAKMER